MLWPSISSTSQPKALNLSGMESMGITSSQRPSFWSRLRSTMTVRLSRPYFAAAEAASQTAPSFSSPSPTRVQIRQVPFRSNRVQRHAHRFAEAHVPGSPW